jgi:hypothetical protein
MLLKNNAIWKSFAAALWKIGQTPATRTRHGYGPS